uniref:Uncharacterized protein n=1 Tax=Panagrolaimus superbus TaxID=310955 RepID=A0A914Z6V7_9BILA
MDFSSVDDTTKINMLKKRFVEEGHYQEFMQLIEQKLTDSIQTNVYNMCLKETEKRFNKDDKESVMEAVINALEPQVRSMVPQELKLDMIASMKERMVKIVNTMNSEGLKKS